MTPEEIKWKAYYDQIKNVWDVDEKEAIAIAIAMLNASVFGLTKIEEAIGKPGMVKKIVAECMSAQETRWG